MTIEKLEYFYVIAKYNSISKASKELHVCNSSLSTALKGLEQELGYDLFIREGKTLKLSENGKNVLPSVMAILMEAKKMKLSLCKNIDRPVINIGTSNASFIFELQQHVLCENECQAKYSHVTSLNALNKLITGEVDFAITSAVIEHPKLEKIFLKRLNFKLAIGNDFCKDESLKITKEVLSKYPFILLSNHPEQNEITRHVVNKLEITPRYVSCHDGLGVNHLLSKGKGIFLITELEREFFPPSLVKILPLPQDLFIDFYLYKCRKRGKMLMMKEVEEKICQIFQSENQ